MMAFFNHFNPKRSKSVPMTVRRISRGTHWTSATPRVATSRARVAAAAKAPSSALRQLTVTPTTRTIVKASTNSTAEAKKAAVATTHCIEKLLLGRLTELVLSIAFRGIHSETTSHFQILDDGVAAQYTNQGAILYHGQLVHVATSH